MPKLTLSKSVYLKEAKKLESYQRFLPSLDLKRKQLVIEQAREKAVLDALQRELQELVSSSVSDLPMLGNEEMDLRDLLRVNDVDEARENRLGVVLPLFKNISIEVKDYGLLTKPHWVDILVKRLCRACELRARLGIQETRLALMQKATRKASQRVNLVSKVLIPEAKSNMRKIQIFLADNERAAVVRSKMAKKKKPAAADVEY